MRSDLFLLFGGVLFSTFAAVYALFSKPDSFLHRRFSAFMLFLAAYLFLQLETATQPQSIFFQRLTYWAGLGAAVSFSDLSFAYPTSAPSNISRYLYVLFFLWGLFVFSPDFIRPVALGVWKTTERGTFFPAYLASFYLIFLFASGRLLLTFSTAKALKERLKVAYLLLGVLLAGAVGVYGTLWLSPLSGFRPLLPPLAFLLLSMFTSYALLQEHPLDMRAFFKKTLFYYLLVAITIGLYVLGVKLLGDFFAGLLGFSSFYVESVLIVLLAFIFKPVAAAVEKMIEKLFARYEGEASGEPFHPERFQEEVPLLYQGAQAVKEHYDLKGATLLLNGKVWGDGLPEAEYEPGRPLPEAWKKVGVEAVLSVRAPEEAALILWEKRSGLALSQEERRELQALLVQVLTQRENIRIKKAIEETTKLLMEREKMAEIGSLSAGLAHELRNPLATIRASAQMLNQALSKVELRQFAQFIMEEVERLQKLVRSFLFFANPQDAEGVVSLSDIVSSVYQREEAQLKGSDKRMVCTLSGENLLVRGDVQILEAAISNVVRNALEATERGEVALSLEASGQEVVFSCEDTGCGIPEEDLQRVFDPFYTTKESGSGLGLAIVKKVVEKAGGEVQVSSAVGSGTKLTLRFPKAVPLALEAEKSL